MPNYKASKNWIKLHDENDASTWTTKTYTPSVALDLVNDYSQIKVIIEGVSTAALVLDCKINAQTDYDINYILNHAGTVSGVQTTGDATIPVSPADVLAGGGYNFNINMTIGLAVTRLTYHWTNGSADAHVIGTAVDGTSPRTTVTSISFIVSTSSIAATSRFQVFGLRR